MRISNRNRGIFKYLCKKISRRYLRNASREYIKTKDQLVTFSFDFISQFIAIDGRFENQELSLIEEIFSGLNPANFPDIKLFENKYQYNQMLVEKNILFYSNCEHHFVPIIGKAHVAYISSGKVIGLSKINRVVQHFAKRPQVQERLTMQISDALKKVLETEDVAVVIDATHLCVSSRGVKDVNSSTVTSHFSGQFAQEQTKNEFLKYLEL